jgi:broad specificity phosphatase PhoE
VSRPDAWLARHGETDWSAAGRHTGRTDVPLNDVGREAAATLGRLFRGHEFGLVLTSPLVRARETCELAGFSDQAVVDDDLREWDYGEYEGRTTAEIRETRPGWAIFEDGCPGGETIAEVAARADRVIARIRNGDGPALVFGHGHALRVAAARWVELPPEAGARLVLQTATLSVLGWERETPAITRWNAP